MSKDKKPFLVQHRREYYNDFEDCLRDYKNQKIKSIQKQTKYHHSDGDNGESDSEYVDCTDGAGSELKNQSTLASKSMPHVSIGDNYQLREQFRLPEGIKTSAAVTPPSATTKTIESTINTHQQVKSNESRRKSVKSVEATTLKNYYYDDCAQSKCESSAQQLKTHDRNNKTNRNNQNVIKVDESGGTKGSVKVNPSTSAISAQRLPQLIDVATAEVRVATNSTSAIAKKDELAKRKSCKKRQGSIKDSTQR